MTAELVEIAVAMAAVVSLSKCFIYCGNGGGGGGVYSPCGKVRTQAYCEDSTNGISCSDRNKNQTPLMSATQLKKISVAKYCP